MYSHTSHTNSNKNINKNIINNNEMKIQNYDTPDVDDDIDLLAICINNIQVIKIKIILQMM